MSLKAGRVGVAPDQVDEFGKVKSDATAGYTKQEADDKFETQAHATSTYETKSEAAALQPKTLSVPIHMLSGTKLTVESIFAGDEGAKTNKELTDLFPTDYSNTGLTFINCSYVAGGYCKIGKIVIVNLRVKAIAADTIMEVDGLPSYEDHTLNNKVLIPVKVLNMTDSSTVNYYAQLDRLGALKVFENSPIIADKEYALSAVYLCD